MTTPDDPTVAGPTVADPTVADPTVADPTVADPTVVLSSWNGTWAADDPHRDLKADVAAYGHLDPLRTLGTLSADSGIPVGALVRYVLARWATGGSESLLELGVSGVDHLARIIADAEAEGTDAARLEAYAAIRDIVGWLRAGIVGPEAGADVPLPEARADVWPPEA